MTEPLALEGSGFLAEDEAVPLRRDVAAAPAHLTGVTTALGGLTTALGGMTTALGAVPALGGMTTALKPDEFLPPPRHPADPPLVLPLPASVQRTLEAAITAPRPVQPAAAASTDTPAAGVLPGAAPATGSTPVTVSTPSAAAGAEPAQLPRPGETLRGGRYLICRLLARGGSGSVVEALDTWRLPPPAGDQRVALKLLRPDAGLSGPRFTAFQREFQHLQSLTHPNIVRVHDFDRDGAIAFFSMEYLSGVQLAKVLTARRGQPLPRPQALAILREVGAAITHAHASGIAHGDLNPANVLVTETGQVRVLDFGASQPLPDGPWIAAPNDPPRVATRAWASCQVLEGGVPVASDDTYSLACLAYMLLTGAHPFGGHTALEARRARLRPRRPAGLSAGGWHALRAGLRFERERRPADVTAWLRRLDAGRAAAQVAPLAQLMQYDPPPLPWAQWLVAAAAAMVVLGMSWWAGVHSGDLNALLNSWTQPAQPGAAFNVPAAPHTP